MEKDKRKEEIIALLNEKLKNLEAEEKSKKLILSLLNFSLILLLLSFLYFLPFAREGYYSLPISNVGFYPLFGLITFLILLFLLRVKA
jgi:hypothetical protein